MAKTKKEILYHLSNVPYNKVGAHKIVAFLLGKGIIAKGEKINFKNPEFAEKALTFDHFYRWFINLRPSEVLTSVIEDLGDRLGKAIENEEWELADRVSVQLECLTDVFESLFGNKKNE